MQPIAFTHDHDGKRYIVRSWSNRLSIINLSNYKVLREMDFVDHATAVFFAGKFSHVTM